MLSDIKLNFKNPVVVTNIVLGFLIVVAGCMRVHELGAKTYHLDEALTVSLVDSNRPFLEAVVRGTTMNLNDVPGEQVFHYLINKYDNSEWGHRLPAVVFGSFSVLLIYLWASLIWGRTAGIAAAILLAFSAYHINISRDAARPTYMLYFFTFALGWSHRLAALRMHWKFWLLFGCLGAIGLMFHVFVLIPLAACGVCACIDLILQWKEGTRKIVIRYILSYGLATLLALTPFVLWFTFAGIRSDPGSYKPLQVDAPLVWKILSAATGSSSSESGGRSARAMIILCLSAVGILSLSLERNRRRELGWLSLLPVLLIYFYELTKGTKYFAVRHSAFIHPFVLFSAAGGIAQLGIWLRNFSTRKFGFVPVSRGVYLVMLGLLLIALTAYNAPVISRYYVYGSDFQIVPFRSIIEFIGDNIKPDEVVYVETQVQPWFFHAYAPHVKFLMSDGANLKLSKDQKGFWYFGPHPHFRKRGFTQIRFDIPSWQMGYCRRKKQFIPSISKFQPSAVAFIDGPLLKIIPEKELFFERAVLKARATPDRQQRAAVLSVYSEYLRTPLQEDHSMQLLMWRLAEEAIQSNPYNAFLRNFSAYCSIVVGKYDLAVRRAKESMEMGFYLWPLLALNEASIKSNGTAINDDDLLHEIDKVLAREDTEGVRKIAVRIRVLRSAVQQRIQHRQEPVPRAKK